MVGIRKWLAVLLVLVVLLLAAACTAPQSVDTSDISDDHGFTTAPLPTSEDGNVTYSVTVLSESGDPIPGVFVQLSLDCDIPAVTDERGVAIWHLPQAAYVVSIAQLPAGYDYTSAIQEFFFADDSAEMTITLMAKQ